MFIKSKIVNKNLRKKVDQSFKICLFAEKFLISETFFKVIDVDENSVFNLSRTKLRFRSKLFFVDIFFLILSQKNFDS